MTRRICALAVIFLAPALPAPAQNPVSTGPTVISALNDAVTVSNLGSRGAVGFQLTGTCTTGVVTFEATVDGTNWSSTEVFPIGSQTGVTTTAAAGQWTTNVTSQGVRMRVSDACDANNFSGTIRALAGATSRMFPTGAAGGTSQADNSGLANLTAAGALFDTTPPSITDGNVGIMRMNSSRELLVNCANCSGSGAIHTDNAAFTGGTDDGAPAFFLFDTTPPTITDGNAGLARMNSSRQLFTEIAAGPTGSSALQGQGTAASDAAVVGNPLFMGGRASTATPTAVSADGDAVGLWLLRTGAAAVNLRKADGTELTPATDYTHDAALTPSTTAGPAQILLAKDFDGAALPNAVSAEGDAALSSGSLSGVLYVMAVNEDGSATGQIRLWDGTDTALVQADGDLQVECSNCSGSGASHVDQAAFTDGTDDGVAIFVEFDATSPTALSEDTAGIIRGSSNRNAYVQIGDGAGNERRANVNASNELLVACSTCSGSGVSHIDDAAFTATTDDVVPIAGRLDNTSPDSVDEDDAGVVRMSANRYLFTQIGDGAGNERRANVNASNELLVACSTCSGSGVSHVDNAFFQAGSDDVVPIAGRFDDTSTTSVSEDNAGVVRMSANRNLFTTLRDAAGNERGANVNASNELLVALSSVPSHAVTNAGTFVVQENGSALTALQTIDDIVHLEDEASGNGHSGALILARRTATPADTSGTDLDYEALQINSGRLYVQLDTLDFAEDAAATSADPGVVALLVREDTPTSTVSANGDYVAPKANSWGHQFVTSLCQDPTLVTSVVVNATASGNTELVALTTNQTIYVCGYNFMSSGTSDTRLVYGTGSACATGETGLTGLYPLIAQTGIAVANAGAPQMKTAVSNALCIELSAAVNVRGIVTYVKF